MIPFDRIYSWLFKSFNISGETELIDRLVGEGYREIMIIKRSWIFAVYTLWIPLMILGLSGLSIWIALRSVDVSAIKYTLVGGNILMSLILIWSSLSYIFYFKSIHHEAEVVDDLGILHDELSRGDRYFRKFFNASLTNQWILIIIIMAEILLMFLYGNQVGKHFWVLATDTFVIILEIILLRYFRKRMTDLEMDYNMVVTGKIFFVNQSGILSMIQTIEGDKIKTIESIFPSKIASFFNYGTINILTEGDSGGVMGMISMYYVTNPDNIVSKIQTLSEKKKETIEKPAPIQPKPTPLPPKTTPITTTSDRRSLDTREKIRDVLR